MDNLTIKEIIKEADGELLPDTNTHQNRFEIKSETSDRLYLISQRKSSGEWECDCPGWIFKRPGKERGCKHLRAMADLLELAAGQTSLPKPAKKKAAKKTKKARA